MARQGQDTLLSRKAQLEEELKFANVFDFVNLDTSTVSIGSVVKVRQTDSGEVKDFWDSDPSQNVISSKTSGAQSLLGRKEKDIVAPISEDRKLNQSGSTENISFDGRIASFLVFL
jgi:transcription elongation GreA/GreB family factor